MSRARQEWKEKWIFIVKRPIIDLDNRLNVTIKKTEIFFSRSPPPLAAGNNDSTSLSSVERNLIFSQFAHQLAPASKESSENFIHSATLLNWDGFHLSRCRRFTIVHEQQMGKRFYHFDEQMNRISYSRSLLCTKRAVWWQANGKCQEEILNFPGMHFSHLFLCSSHSIFRCCSGFLSQCFYLPLSSCCEPHRREQHHCSLLRSPKTRRIFVWTFFLLPSSVWCVSLTGMEYIKLKRGEKGNNNANVDRVTHVEENSFTSNGSSLFNTKSQRMFLNTS